MKIQSEVVRKIDMILIEGPVRDSRMSIDMDPVKELAESIDEVGLMVPILLAKKGERFEIVWGHRRFLAHKHLGKTKILAKVQELNESQIIIMRATENIHREDITPIEEARIYQTLMTDEGMEIEEIAKRMRKSPGIVRRRMDLLRMPELLQDAVQKREINYGVAESLWKLGDVARISYYLQFAIENGASVSVVRTWVKDEQDKQRRERTDVEGGGGTIAVNENIPQFIACQLCKNPVELGKDTIIRACPVCTKQMLEILNNV
ncbi:MAG TPA: ParB/RepB/Spo0J family partition protein [Pricia sp.]|nr:ParB/RepB/Spo0J family partition protein [Pricia sp.]